MWVDYTKLIKSVAQIRRDFFGSCVQCIAFCADQQAERLLDVSRESWWLDWRVRKQSLVCQNRSKVINSDQELLALGAHTALKLWVKFLSKVIENGNMKNYRKGYLIIYDFHHTALPCCTVYFRPTWWTTKRKVDDKLSGLQTFSPQLKLFKWILDLFLLFCQMPIEKSGKSPWLNKVIDFRTKTNNSATFFSNTLTSMIGMFLLKTF